MPVKKLQKINMLIVGIALLLFPHTRAHCGYERTRCGLSAYTKCPEEDSGQPVSDLFTPEVIEEELEREIRVQAATCPAPQPSLERQNLSAQLYNITETEFQKRLDECDNEKQGNVSRTRRDIPTKCSECKSESDVTKQYAALIGQGVDVTFVNCTVKGEPIAGTTSLQTCGECIYLVQLPKGFFPRSHPHRTCMQSYCLTGFGNCIQTQQYPTLKKKKNQYNDIPFGKGCCCQADQYFSTFV